MYLVLPRTMTVGAASGSLGGASSTGDVFGLIWAAVLFAIILALGWFATRWAKKRGGVGALGGANLEVVESRAVGVGAYLEIVRAGKKFYLVGVTKDRVSLIAEVDGAEVVSRQGVDAPFAGVLSRFLGKAKEKEAETEDKDGKKDD